MNLMENFESLFARHSIKAKGEQNPESPEYKGISEKGVDLAKERATDLLKMLDQAKDGTVMFMGGATDQVRTKSTALAMGAGVKELLKKEKREDVVVIDFRDIFNPQKKYPGMIREIVGLIEKNKDKKVLIDAPMFLKEFNGQQWMNEKGGESEYTTELLRRNNNNQGACVKDWFNNKGKIGDLEGPNPTKVAEEHLHGIERLHEFSSKYIKDREIMVGMVGHSWNLDALATYLANNGVVDEAGFEKAGGKMIAETQIGQIKLAADGKSELIYGGKEFPIGGKNEKE